MDLIAIGRDGAKVALQVKNNSKTKQCVGVSAVQEVYAGGKYYNCSKFCVVSFTGYTKNAKLIADKLGVMLLTEKCELYDFKSKFHTNAKNFWIVNGKVESMAVTFKREGWGNDTARFADKTYEQVKEYYDRQIKRKAELEKIRELGLSDSFVKYRMEKLGMSFEKAINTPKLRKGRPRKTSVASPDTI